MALSPSGLLTRLSGKHLHVHVCGFKSTTQGSSFFKKGTAMGVLLCFVFFVWPCLLFLPFPSLINMYMYMYTLYTMHVLCISNFNEARGIQT